MGWVRLAVPPSHPGQALTRLEGAPASISVLVWEVRSGAGMRALGPHPGGAFAVTWESSGERLLSGSSDGRVRWWEVQRGECVRVQQAHHEKN